ncbi:hypothetical protein UFOVP1604_145 [uncultured Caudovirales phage]|uniref:Uncharacterized protein n=1 Tax=uncultured Caudovirales phage TaxID=2100421 RepID=A0A6J5SU29_9CAUD|nr:hypothetical protein UFOVP1604_145 [uncultured Caudovirales phage]
MSTETTEKKDDTRVNVLDGILKSTELQLASNLLVFSVGASYASVLVEKLKSKFPDVTYVTYAEVNSIIYREADANKVISELERRKQNLKKQVDDYTRTIAKVMTKKK